MDQAAQKVKPGECLWCRIEAPAPGGYKVSVVKTGLKGFLPATDKIEIGKVVPSTFVCMNEDEALFTFAFTMGTSAKVQHSTLSDEANAFSVWVDAFPKSMSFRRAVDLVMPPISSSSMLVKLDTQKAREIISTLDESQFTGCMKINCESAMSRAALIFFRGRAVGSIYTRKPMRDPYGFEIGMRKLVEDLTAENTDADMEMYELPEEIVLSMASLFLGYVDRPDAKGDRNSYAEKMLQHFFDAKNTGCFNLLDTTDTSTAFGFVCKGEFRGTYTIGEQVFNQDKNFLLELLAKDPEFKLQVHILPPAMMTEAVVLGYALNTEQFGFKPNA